LNLAATFRKMKIALIMATVLFVCSFMFGWYITGQGLFELEMRLRFTDAFGWLHQPFSTLSNLIIQSIFPWTRPLEHYQPASQIPTVSPTQLIDYVAVLALVGFVIDMLFTFATTTVPGMMPFFGGILVESVASVEVALGQSASYAHEYLDVFNFPPNAFLFAIIPILLTVIVMTLSSSAGINIACAPVHAVHGSRWLSFKEAWKEGAQVYLLIAVLLATGI
jgi:hypothetical protein